MDQRKQLLNQWLGNAIESSDFSIEPASEDASFRSYYRLKHKQKSFIVMDAPPEHENCEPFIQVQKMMSGHQVNVPQIHAFNKEQGFMLLSDFGDVQLLDVLDEDNAIQLYKLAIDELLKIQNIKDNLKQLPTYDQVLLNNEMNLFSEWFIGKHLGLELSPGQKQVIDDLHLLLINNALEQPKVMVHRDYHSRNIMLTDGAAGIIDFQDAVYGPISYDIASLLKDCYIKWPSEIINQLLEYFLNSYNQLNQTELSANQFTKWFDLMAAQRHMKAIGIFCRLNYRDNKKKFLNDVPRTMSYLTESCEKYSELSDFAQVLSDIKPKIHHS